MRRFKKCDKPDCNRLTHEGTLYCCSNCRSANEGADKFELTDEPDAHPLLRHTTSCDQRAENQTGKRVGDYDDKWSLLRGGLGGGGVNPPYDRKSAIGFYWAKVVYHFWPEPLIHWEVLHWDDDHWWSTASSVPFPDDDVLEFREKLVAPE